MNIYLIMTLGGLLGIIGHVLKDVNSINKRLGEKTDFKMVFSAWWTHDKLAFMTSCFFFLLLLFVANEFIDLKHLDTVDKSAPLKERLIHFQFAAFIKTVSVIAGWFSDSIVYGFMGVTEKRLQKQFADLEPEKK